MKGTSKVAEIPERAQAPVVSIIVPVYNAKKYLSTCIDSILDQNRGDIEIILVDDGSSDGSELICRQYSEKFSHLVSGIRKSNQGSLLARVDGFRMASGSYVMTVDADDALLPGSLDALIKAIQETGDDVITWEYTINEEDTRPDVCSKKISYSEPSKLIMLKRLCASSNENAMWRKAVRRECLRLDIDYLPYAGMRFDEDFLQTVIIYDRAESYCVMNNVLYYYRDNPNGITNTPFTRDYYLDSVEAVTVAERYARRWEEEYGCSGLISSLSGQGLWHTAKFALQLVRSNQREEFMELAFSDFFCSRYSRSALTTLRIDKRIVLHLLKSRQWHLARFAVGLLGALRGAMHRV